MKDVWLERYINSLNLRRKSLSSLVGFNANIDIITDYSSLGEDMEEVEPEKTEEVENIQQLRSLVKYAEEEGQNIEVDSELEPDLENTVRRIGGQAGIMSNYLSKTGNRVIFYTPFLSDDLVDALHSEIMFPLVEGGLRLKRVEDAVNSDRTKENTIIEYSLDHSGRVILSDRLRGFGPYFRSSVEENFDSLDEEVERVLLSGFHNVKGNKEAKLRKAGKQVEKIKSPVHVEFVHRNDDLSMMTLEKVVSKAESMGIDQDELRELCRLEDIEYGEEPKEIFESLNKLMEETGLERIHLHTLTFHIALISDDYEVDPLDLRNAMLYGNISAIRMSEEGDIPGEEDLQDFSMEGKHLHNLDPVREISDHLNAEKLVEKGFESIDGKKIVAVPTIINEDPERVVGMGDIISAAAFTSETKKLSSPRD